MDLVFCFNYLDPPSQTSVLVLFAEVAVIFDLLEVESSPNMKWKANAKLKGALNSKFLSGINVVFF